MAAPISLEQALQRVLTVSCAGMPPEQVDLERCLGRTLAGEIAADGPWPSTDRSAMDGFAVHAGAAGIAAGTALPVVGESLAGHPFAGRLGPGQALRIMTGAVVPGGADAVVPVERTSGLVGSTVTLHEAVGAGANVRRAGSEVAAGQVLLRSGTRIRAAEVGALAVLGRVRVPVFRRPVVAILATGDEVVPVDRAPEPYQVRESNSWALMAQVQEAGGEPLRLGIAPDESGALKAMLRSGLERADLLLTIGGVSKGSHDLVHGTLQELGVREVFHGVAVKPGKPTFFGRCSGFRAGFVFGLPGNPASSFSMFDLLVAPLLERMLGRVPRESGARARLGGAPFRPNPRLQAAPARLGGDAEGVLRAELLPPSPSGDPFGLLGGDGYALLPPGATPADTRTAPVLPYAAGLRRP
jgi:molybdopterin molybdotransferase